MLRVGYGIEPRTPDEIGGEDFRHKLLEKPGTGTHFNADALWFAVGYQSRKEFVAVDTPQRGFSIPDAAVPQKLFLSLFVDGHGWFFDCTGFGEAGLEKLARMFRRVTNGVADTFRQVLTLLNFDTLI